MTPFEVAEREATRAESYTAQVFDCDGNCLQCLHALECSEGIGQVFNDFMVDVPESED